MLLISTLVFVTLSCAISAEQGDATWYDIGLGACGWWNNNGERVAAVSQKVYGYQANPNNSPICGKTAVVRYGGKSVSVKIVDKCMGCRDGDIDLSPSAFEKLARKEVGRIRVSWEIQGSGGGSGGSGGDGTTVHIVQSGESLWLIAEQYGVSGEAIAAYNNIPSPYWIYPGQQLSIPDN